MTPTQTKKRKARTAEDNANRAATRYSDINRRPYSNTAAVEFNAYRVGYLAGINASKRLKERKG